MNKQYQQTSSGLKVPACAEPDDIADRPVERIGRAGSFPFTRGIHPGMYRDRPWTVRQLAGFGSPSDTNARYRLLLDQGATGINGVFDYPSLRAFGSDDERARSDVGRGGVAVDVVGDFTDLFAEIPLDSVSTSLVSSQPIGAVPHLAMHLVAAQRRGYAPADLMGTSQNDFLMETAITIAPLALGPTNSFRLACDLIEYSVRELPRWNPVSIAGYNYREAGADAVLEMALSLAHGRAIVAEMKRRGVPPEVVLHRISFFLNAHNDFFEEIAKFRAIRRMWARYVRDELGVTDERCQRFRFHTQTSGVTNTAHYVHVNIVRSGLQALAAVLGGTQSLHINGYDEALSIPSEHAAMTALRTQYVLLHETGVASLVDPLGGSWQVESMTDAIEEAAGDVLRRIIDDGGVVASTENGWVHAEIGRCAYAQQRAIDQGQAIFVGLNSQTDAPEDAVTAFELPDDTLQRQCERVEQVRQTRDRAGVHEALDALARACETDSNVMPAAIAAAQANCTLGEVGDLFRRTLGTWNPPLW